jgi:tryptophan-rich sensory protein
MRKSSAALLTGTAVGAAAGAGSRFGPTPNHPRTAAWYARLNKPAVTPPGPVFGLAWTIMDGLLWFSGYRLFIQPAGPRRNLAVGLWGITMLGVGGFQYVLFGRKHLAQAAGVSAGMVASTAGLVAAAATVDKQAARALVPLALWTTLAFLLQEEVWRRNPQERANKK